MIKNLYYNIQLISSFLLNKTHFLFILFLAILNSNNILSLAFCDESVDTLVDSKNNNVTENNNNFVLYFGIGIIIGVFIAILYLNSGGDAGNGFSLFSNDNVSPKVQNVTLVDQIQSTPYMSNELAATKASQTSILKTHNQLRANFVALEYQCEALQKNQTSVYNFMGEMMINHPETYEDISKYIEKHPQIIFRGGSR